MKTKLLSLLLACAALARADDPRLVNLATRAQAGTGSDVLTAGFVIGPGANKTILVRAVGPTLAVFGVRDVLPDPVVTLTSGGNTVATNDDWSSTNASMVAKAAAGVGAFAPPAGSRDAALLVTLAPGAYTVEVRGKNGAEGIALFEIYEVP